MRAVFSLLGLVVTLAIVAVLVKSQFRAEPTPAQSAAQAANSKANPDLPVVPVVTPGNAKQIQDQVRADVERAMQQGVREMPE